MRFTSRVRSAAVALPFAFALGCGGDGPTGPLNALSAEDAIDAFDALSTLTELDIGVGIALRAEPSVRVFSDGMPVASLTIPINEAQDCLLGGTTSVGGSITIDEDTFDGSADLRQNYSNCIGESSSGRLWTFNGSPNVRIQMSFDGETGAGGGTMTGGFRYSSEGDSGRCTMSLTLTFTQLGGSINGTACGQPISETFTDNFPVSRVPDQG